MWQVFQKHMATFSRGKVLLSTSIKKSEKVGKCNAGDVRAAEPSGANPGLNMPEQHGNSLWTT